MSRTQRIAIAALLASVGSSEVHAQAAPADVRSIPPVMMLLVDTSGSMERMTDDTRLPVCKNNPATDATEKNRWTVTLEALTGTFSAFSCEEVDRSTLHPSEMDYGYYLPHFRVTSTAQASDGILDAFMNRLKFGLMTFDGSPTLLGGETLIPYDIYVSSSFQAQVDGPLGMYDYGTDRKLSFPGCPQPYGLNVGARGKGTHPGALISVGSDATIAAVNAQIQDSLRNVRPFGATPLAAMFEDLREYLETDPDVKAGADGDVYHECRSRYALLITDSAGDAGELYRDARFRCQTEDPGLPGADCPDGHCQCPYEEDAKAVALLTSGSNALLDKLFILAFNVTNEAALDELDTLAEIGGSGKAIRATSPDELRQALSNLMASVQGDATSRSVPVAVQSSTSPVFGGTQYEITTGFKVGANVDEPWEGLLYRRRIGCGENATVEELSLDENEGDMFHRSLNEQPDGSRVIRTLAPQSLAYAKGTLRTANVLTGQFNGDVDNIKEPTGSGEFGGTPPTDSSLDLDQGLSSTNVAEAPFVASTSLNEVYFGGSATRDKVADYVRGLSRPGKKLADIYHSQPAVLPPLDGSARTLQASDERLANARAALATSYVGEGDGTGRPGVVFVGTNDGILHAFNLETARISGTEYAAGHEFWGFVPPALFPKLPTAAIPTHVSMFDGSPVVADVSSPRGPLDSAAPTFYTVLVSNVRGAPAFVALDVTHPEELKPLWQFSDVYMGNTVGRAAVTHVVLDWNGTVQQRAVAILPGGRGETSSSSACDLSNTKSEALSGDQTPRSKGRCWKLPGRSLYVVDLLTGSLIQRFDPRHFNAPLSGSAVVDSPGLGVSKAAYITDEDGILWRLSMVSTNPSQWRVQPVWDIFAGDEYDEGRPATFPPIVTHDELGNVVVIVGTGDLDNLIDPVKHRIVSLTEQRSVAANGEFNPENAMTLNWEIVLDESESVTGPLVKFQDTVYFGTFLSTSDAENACALGSSSLYGAHYRLADDDEPPLPRGMLHLVNEEQPVLSVATDPNTLVLGVTITQQPVCMAGSVENDPNGYNALIGGGAAQRFAASGAASGGGFQLRALAGGSGGQQYGGSELREIRQNINVTRAMSVRSWAASVE